MPEERRDLFAGSAGLEKARHIYTVSEITRDIKAILENTFPEVWVEGEVSNFRAANSGHFYFSLKDNDALIGAAMFSRANKELKFKLEDGLKVICSGKIDVYMPRGQYQLIVEKIEPKGIGAQQLAFEQLKKKLSKEGLFDPAHKKELPLMLFCVGIVTSSAGAAVRDILQILKKGAPCVDALIRSVRVQGEGAGKEIAQGIVDLNQLGTVDAIIVSRGGGSSEDLWAFNEEAVARAIYNSRIPTISAVGHQINITLSDMVADCFVETPSAAAKLIVDKRNSLLSETESLRQQLKFSIAGIIGNLKHDLVALRHMLKSPKERLQEKVQFLDEVITRLHHSMGHFLNIHKERLSSLAARLGSLSPLAVLSRGYSLTSLYPDGAIVKDASQVKTGERVKTALSKGFFVSRVEEVNKDG
ncbi:MAG: exodeoxyribonuclease VII large subunit [Candidatus Omnitrophica bacterium]|nr:exodeoxyribonuclease VII large subunit [Candidatus Omnitrophota bacterium]